MITINRKTIFISSISNVIAYYLIVFITFSNEKYIATIIPFFKWDNCGYFSFILNLNKDIYSSGCRSPPNQFELKNSN